MNKVKLISVILLFACCNNTHAQSIDAINKALDNSFYANLTYLDYQTPVTLPDSTKQKVINILNGYLPLWKIKEASTFDVKHIERKCKEICGTDSLCNALAKDSIIKASAESNLFVLRQHAFPASFILSIGTWNVKEAEPILLKNINSKRYPQRETKLALAKLGNDSVKQRIMEEYTLKYIVNNTILKDDNPELIYQSIPIGEQISDQINSFFKAGMYLKERQILFNLVDLLDIQGKEYFVEDLVPIEESFLIWMSTRFMSRELLLNGKYDKWENIINTYIDAIDDNKNSAEISNILSRENKEKIKKQLKDWIVENVNFP